MPKLPSISQIADQLGSDDPKIVDMALTIAKQIGTPITIKNTNSRQRLLFLFEGDTNTQNVVMYCPVIKSSIASYTMQRHPRSNVWFKIIELPEGALCTYSFAANDPLEGWPGTPENLDGDIISRLKIQGPDPLNRDKPYRPLPGVLPSYAASVIDLRINVKTSSVEDTTPKMPTINEVFLAGRRTWQIKSTHAAPPSNVLVLFDGDYYLEGLNILKTHRDLLAKNPDFNFDLLLIENPNSTRRSDLFDGPDFYSFVTSHVHRLLMNSGYKKIFLGGLSAGGYAAVNLTISNPTMFSGAISQSGSFWWPFNEKTQTQEELLIKKVEAESLKPYSLSFSLSIGSLEDENAETISMLNCNRRMHAALKAAAANVVLREHPAGHEGLAWETYLSQSIEDLVSLRTNKSPSQT